MIIREATIFDWEEMWVLLSEMGKTDNKEKTKQRFLTMINVKEHFIPVAINKGNIVGYGWVQDYGFHLRMGKKTCRLNDLFVLPEYRNSGIAKNIFLSIKNWAKGNETAWLQWNSSPSAVQFYKKLGYSPLIEEDDFPSFEIEF
jgi:GNAT superfamily N-acetyltransferase